MAIRIYSKRAESLITSSTSPARIAAAASGGGEYGLFYAGVPSDGAANDVWLFGLKQDDLSRSNVAVVGEGVFSALLRAYDGDTGQEIPAQHVVTSASQSTIVAQLNGYPESRNAYVQIVRTTGSGPFVCYGVVNDGPAPNAPNGTNDGSYLAMVPGDY